MNWSTQNLDRAALTAPPRRTSPSKRYARPFRALSPAFLRVCVLAALIAFWGAFIALIAQLF